MSKTDQILLSFVIHDDHNAWVVDILRETEKGYDYLGAIHGIDAKNLYSQIAKGDGANEYRKTI